MQKTSAKLFDGRPSSPGNPYSRWKGKLPALLVNFNRNNLNWKYQQRFKMPDNLTRSQRSHCMSRVRTKDTDLERAIRSALHRRGFRFRKHVPDLPGKPDIVFVNKRLAVFIDGDFWHGFRFSAWRDKLSEFWQRKIDVNRQRDQRNFKQLKKMGWRVLRIWQHQIKKDPQACVVKIIDSIESQSGRS